MRPLTRVLVWSLCALLVAAISSAQLITGGPGIPSGGAVGGTCATLNALARFTAAQTLACSTVVDTSGALTGITTAAMSGALTSTLATGSPPFVVASTTRVSNLNVATAGLADTATALATPRTINGVSFDGTANITVSAAAGTLTGTTLNATVVTSSLTSVGTLAGLTVTAPLSVISIADANPVRFTGVSGGPARVDWYSGSANAAARDWTIRTDGSAFGALDFYQSTAINGDPFAAGTIRLTLSSLGANAPVMNVGSVSAPATEFQVASTVTTSPRGVMSSQYNAGTDGARFHMRKARGTEASPTVIVSGDNMGRLVASAFDGASYLEMASIIFGTEGTIASTRVPSNLVFQTATNAAPSVLTTAVTIDSGQKTTFAGTIKLPNGAGGSISNSAIDFNGGTGFYAANSIHSTLRVSGTSAIALDTIYLGQTTEDVTISRSGVGVLLVTGSSTTTGHIQSSTTAPAVTNTTSNSCGTTAATIVGTDVAGKVTVGATAGTSCTVTFTTAYTNAPACMATNETTANLSRATSTTTTVIIAGTFVAGDVLAYMCLGRV